MEYWYCIYTKPKKEDLVCRQLMKLPEIEVFNPKLKRKKYVRSRLTQVVEELFPCYIFLKLNLERYFHLVKYTRGVKRFVGDSFNMPYTVDESIIDFIKSKRKEGFIHIEPPGLTDGDRVVILKGPFSGLTGIFLKETKPNERIMILLNTIEYQAKVEIEKELIAKA